MNTQSKDGHKIFYCYYLHFTSLKILSKHKEVCLTIYVVLAPFVIYADFECITSPPENDDIKHGVNTTVYRVHKACGYGYKVVCHYDNKYSKPLKI